MDVKFSFEDNGKSLFGQIMRPIAKVNLTSPTTDNSVDVWMIVDTGADYTILPRHFYEKLRISLEKDCFKETTYGIGGEGTVCFFKNTIKAKIGDKERDIPIAFLDSNEVPALMGRLGFLETFDTDFLKNFTVVFKN